jgi:hypothetical protein
VRGLHQAVAAMVKLPARSCRLGGASAGGHRVGSRARARRGSGAELGRGAPTRWAERGAALARPRAGRRASPRRLGGFEFFPFLFSVLALISY